MEWLLPIAAKSFLIGGLALLLLAVARKRSAAQRSWIAHLGLAAVLLLPVAAVALPPLEVRGPAFLAQPAAERSVAQNAPSNTPSKFDKESAAAAGTFPAASSGPSPAARTVDWPIWIYAAPAALLILFTLIALGRLVTLRARANVLVEANWLTALARAQRRMGFKHGTALLTSDELPSPISWGLMRPVILLNSEAAKSHEEAEAIIAHELAHVASLDWAKLLLGRVTVALFWFNPLVWLLAREAHQLREEAADDAVLGADIEDTDYAKLLVGVARHECRGLLIGAHGVAPGRNSLSRRVRRVLDSSLTRGPVGRAFALGMFAGASMLAAPLAALTLTNKPAIAETAAPGQASAAIEPQHPYYASPAAAPVATRRVEAAADAAVAAAQAAVAATDPALEAHERALDALDQAQDARDAQLDAMSDEIDAAVDDAIASSRHAVVGARMSASAAFGVTPAYVRDLEASGMRGLSASQLRTAAIHGVNGPYLRSMAAVGYPHLSFSDAVAMRIHGVTPDFVRSLQRRGIRNASPRDVIKMRILGPGWKPRPDIDRDADDDDDPDDA